MHLSTAHTLAPQVLAWSRTVYAAMSPYISTAVYVNYLDRDLCNATLTSYPWELSYYGANYDRLASVKAAYDPSRVFQWPQAIGAVCNFTAQ